MIEIDAPIVFIRARPIFRVSLNPVSDIFGSLEMLSGDKAQPPLPYPSAALRRTPAPLNSLGGGILCIGDGGSEKEEEEEEEEWSVRSVLSVGRH